MDLGVIGIQLEVVETLNMNVIFNGRCVWSLDKIRLWTGPCHRGILVHSWEQTPTLAWYSQSLDFYRLTPTVLRYAQDPALGLAKLLCSGSLLGHGPLLPSTDGILTASAFQSLNSRSLTNHSKMPYGGLGTWVKLLALYSDAEFILLSSYISSALRTLS